MVSPNARHQKEDKLLYPDHYLVCDAKVDSGPHSVNLMIKIILKNTPSQSKMADDELAEIRARRMAELQQQMGVNDPEM